MSARPEIIFVVARAKNGVIGRDNGLPWRLKADLAHFKRVTMGQAIVMGRKTWESLGRPLPGRRNLVVTRNPAYVAEGAEVFASPQAAIAATNTDKVCIIGGAELYRQLLPTADRLMVTEVDAEVDGDAHFPAFDTTEFVEVSRECHSADADNDHDFAFVEYRRR
ncbi:MAG: dihydrofolate reductase [Pseudazoarcus pumilus]|nr:dihydrofolate reductase [Pseudazoarcus pumilus]